MHKHPFILVRTVIIFAIIVIAAPDILFSANAGEDENRVRHIELAAGFRVMPGHEISKQDRSNLPSDGEAVSSVVKKVEAKKGIVAFIELSSTDPTDVYLLYPSQYDKYKSSGLLEGVIEYRHISWLFYPIPALLEDQTVYVVAKGNVAFNITYENIQERIDRLFAGEEQLRAGAELLINGGTNVIRLSPLIPGLKVRLDFTEKAQFVIIRTIDLARYNKGLKSFEQLYQESELKGISQQYDFLTSNFEDLYILVRTENQNRMKYMIRATAESAESGC